MPANIVFRSLSAAVLLWLSAGSSVAAQSAVDLLEPDKAIERDLAGGETHSYFIRLASGQVLQAFIAQPRMDLTVTLFGPDGRQAGQFDSLWHGPEPVFYVAEASGNYRLEIRTVNPTATRGSYQLKLEKNRAPAPPDRTRVAAIKASTEGKLLLEQGKAQTIIPAKKKCDEALPLWREIGDRFQEAQTLDNIGFLFWTMGGAAKGIEYYNQALAIRREIKDSQGEGETLNNIGAAYSALGKKELALEYYNRALPLRPGAADLAATLGNLGAVYFYLGQTQKAIEYYNQALPLWRSAGARAGEVNALLGLGSILKTLGENQQALDYLHRGAKIARESNDSRGEAHAANYLSRLYLELGETDKALDFSGQALTLFKSIGDFIGRATALNNHGVIHHLRGDREKALDFYNQALFALRAMSDGYVEAFVLIGLGKLYSGTNERQKATGYYNQALALYRKNKQSHGEAVALFHLGEIYASSSFSEERRKALDHFHQALFLYREVGDRQMEAATLLRQARVERDLGDLNKARGHIEAALAIRETLRIKIGSQQLRATFFGLTRDYYDIYIDLLMSLHRLQPSERHDVSALGASERARARSLLETLSEARADISEGIAASLLERERSLQKRINAGAEYQFRLLGDKHTREQMEAAKRDLASLIDELRQVEAEIRKTSPRYAELKFPQPIGLPEIQGMLDSETMLLEYSLGEERSYLWAVTPDGIESFELPKRAEIENLARQSYKWLAAAETGAQLRARLARRVEKTPEWAASLSRILLGPVASRLGRKRLVIVADGALQYIPFGALPAPNRAGRTSTLITNHEIVTLPSASNLAALRRETADRATAPKIVAVIADPVFDESDERINKNGGNQAVRPAAERDVFRSALESGATDEQQRLQRLRFSRIEADEIMRLAKLADLDGSGAGFEALDFAANRATALGSNLGRYRILHFATHSLLNSQHPELSGIVLSLVDQDGSPQDGFLRLHDIYNMNLGADLVVLSACNTGLGKEIKGEGLLGLTRGFLYAGAPRVVASLWKVDDRATAELMKLFYKRMLRDGLRPAAALRRAKIDLSRQPRWAVPYYWAGFTIQGEWK